MNIFACNVKKINSKFEVFEKFLEENPYGEVWALTKDEANALRKNGRFGETIKVSTRIRLVGKKAADADKEYLERMGGAV